MKIMYRTDAVINQAHNGALITYFCMIKSKDGMLYTLNEMFLVCIYARKCVYVLYIGRHNKNINQLV